VFPPQRLECPDPARCPVTPGLPRLKVAEMASGTALYRVYDGTWGYDEHNPGFGDARFSPFDDVGDGHRVPSMYLAATPVAALLETVFHEVHQSSGRIIYQRDLRGKLLAHLRLPSAARVGDLRDAELVRRRLRRDQVVSSPAEHYPCTRRLAVAARDKDGSVQGLIWHSRHAELAGHPATEVLVLFGDSFPSGRGSWPLTGPGIRNLYDGPGRLLIDQVAEDLGAVVEPET
jgi:RES domain